MSLIKHVSRFCVVVTCAVLCAACDGGLVDPPPTATPAREFTAPTLEPSPTVHIQSSGDLYIQSDINPGQLNATAAALPANSSLPPVIIGTSESGSVQSAFIVLEDGTQLVGDLYQRNVSRLPGVLLIAPDKESWGFLPVRLYNAGMTVFVLETTDSMQVIDMEVMLTSLSEIGTVDPAHIAVVASERAIDIALPGCVNHGICDAMVLLSPSNRTLLLDAIRGFTPRPVLVSTGIDDAMSYTTSIAIAGAATGTSRLVSYPAGRGTQLLELQPELIDTIVEWLSSEFTLFMESDTAS